MSSQARIVQVSNWLYWLVSGVSLAIVPVLIWIVATQWHSTDWLVDNFPALPPETVLSRTKSVLILALSGLALAPLFMAILRMRSLFDHYRSREILTEACARDIVLIGQWLMVMAGVRLMLPTLEMLALTFDNPPGARMLTVALSSNTVAVFLMAGLLTVIGWALRDAARIADENAGFV